MTHQRLNGSGYVFSASLPPYLSCVASAALKRIRSDKKRRTAMHSMTKLAHSVLRGSKYLQLRSSLESPIVHVEWKGNGCSPSNQSTWLAAERRLQVSACACACAAHCMR